MSALILVLTPATGSATHNVWRHWAAQQSGIYNYAPCYWFYAEVPTSFRTRFADARLRWNGAGTEFNLWPGTCSRDIVVRYFDLAFPFQYAWAFTVNEPSPAPQTSPITGSTINFNSCMNPVIGPGGQLGPCVVWYTGTGTPPATQLDAISNQVHELGHTVELTHSSVCDSACSVMYPSIAQGQMRRNLNAHDLASIRAMYAYPAH